jgi:hypothetical protein
MQGQIVISSVDKPLTWVQPLRQGIVIAHQHTHVVLDHEELVRLIDVASEIERRASAMRAT